MAQPDTRRAEAHRSPTTSAAPTATYLGPGMVTRLDGPDLLVRLDTAEEVTAQMAMPFPYIPAPDDVLLVIGMGERHYVIGVIHGQGTASLTFPGDVEMRSLTGAFRMTAPEGIELTTQKDIEVRAGKVRVLAGTVVQKVTDVFQWIKGKLHVRATRTDASVAETAATRAHRVEVIAEDDVKVDGRQVFLG